MEGKEIVRFLRKRDYLYIDEIGHGACGKTYLIRDDMIEEDFVCKKFSPITEEERDYFYEKFVQEIKLMYSVFHRNIVRIFNYYLYPEQKTGYILMEYINGKNISEYIKNNPTNVDKIFVQIVEGFKYLEDLNILHRDIRPKNILVTENGVVKIIDFGFGKQVKIPDDITKSVSLNWIAEPPSEFDSKIYDTRTEIYFIGKLFEIMIKENKIINFKFKKILKQMCEYQYEDRVESFEKILSEIYYIDSNDNNINSSSTEIFEESELEIYRNFSNKVFNNLIEMERKPSWYSDEKIIKNLDDAFTSCMLEEFVPSVTNIVNCFISANYKYNDVYQISVEEFRKFIDLINNTSVQKASIIIKNIKNRLNSLPKNEDYDLPF